MAWPELSFLLEEAVNPESAKDSVRYQSRHNSLIQYMLRKDASFCASQSKIEVADDGRKALRIAVIDISTEIAQ